MLDIPHIPLIGSDCLGDSFGKNKRPLQRNNRQDSIQQTNISSEISASSCSVFPKLHFLTIRWKPHVCFRATAGYEDPSRSNPCERSNVVKSPSGYIVQCAVTVVARWEKTKEIELFDERECRSLTGLSTQLHVVTRQELWQRTFSLFP